jgi:hypothetical protein
MTIVREPVGIEFTVVPTTLTAQDRREISEHIAKDRQQQNQPEMVREAQEILSRYARSQQKKSRDAKTTLKRKQLEARALTLPASERTQLAYQLLSSLAAEEFDLPEHRWAVAAKVQFEQLHAEQTPVSAPPEKKPRQRPGAATAKRRVRSPSSK